MSQDKLILHFSLGVGTPVSLKLDTKWLFSSGKLSSSILKIISLSSEMKQDIKNLNKLL